MSYKLKTIIVFDTNSLRKIRVNNKEKEYIDYSNFDFGTPFKVIKEFIDKKKIQSEIHLGIPDMVISELQNQCEKQFQRDCKVIKDALKRISEIPSKKGIDLNDPDKDFNYKTFIQEKIKCVLEENNIIIIPFDESKTPIIFKNMFEKVLDVENVKSPFRPKDAGFKDNIIWESLLNFEEIEKYDKVIFLSKDGDFKNNCIEEFKEKWERHIKIEKDENNVIAEIQKDYGNYIEERAIYEFTQSEYFENYLNDELKLKTTITFGNLEYNIENYRIVDFCKNVDRRPPNENDVENILVTSLIKIFYTENGIKKEQIVKASTLLWDEESKDIQPPTEFNLDIK